MMRKHSTLMIILLLQILLQITTVLAQPKEPQLDFNGGICKASDTISITGTYHKNILNLFSNLQSLSSVNKFNTSSSGDGPNRVNGYYLCRPDLSLSTCEECITATITTVNQHCSDRKEAIIWYDECMIRYTNNSISSTEGNGTDPWYFNYSNFNVSKTEGFPKLVKTTMKGLISQAVSPDSQHKFFTYGEKNFTAFEGFFGMVLCRPDITSEACESCLETALDRIPSCCVDSLSSWTMVMMPNCQLRYDTAPFIFPTQQQL